MGKETRFQSELDERVTKLKARGVSDDWIKLLRTSMDLQIKFLPSESILRWLDEQISKVIVKEPKRHKSKRGN